MKFCIFSDVHGNYSALQQLIHKEKTSAYFFFVGDIFGYFYEQKSVINQLMKMKNLYAIKGNHEQNYLICRDNVIYKKQLVKKYGNSYNLILSQEELTYIQQLPKYMEIRLENKKIGIFHGGLNDYMNQRIYPDSHLNDALYGTNYDYLFLGHTHYHFTKTIGKTLLINPGSIGQPRDGKGFSYCILNTTNNEVVFKTIKLNLKQLLKTVKELDLETNNYEYLLKKYKGYCT